MASVKWLTRIEAIDHQHRGYQMEAYTFLKHEGDPNGVLVTTQKVKSILAPPGTVQPTPHGAAFFLLTHRVPCL